jgi:hypothetical protein
LADDADQALLKKPMLSAVAARGQLARRHRRAIRIFSFHATRLADSLLERVAAAAYLNSPSQPPAPSIIVS